MQNIGFLILTRRWSLTIFKTSNYIDVYRIKSQSKKIEAMSGRDRDSTDFVINRIASALNFQSNDIVLDIGCGDGTLLTNFSNKFEIGVGIVPTEAEVSRLKTTYNIDNVKFKKGLSSSLPEASESYSKVICNSVIFILPSYENLVQTISEIARVVKVGGKVYLGEVMIIDELADARRQYGDSLVRWLEFTLRKRGFKSFVLAIQTLVKSSFTNEPFIIAPKELLIVSPDEIIQICSECKLKLVETSVHQLRDERGEVYEISSRMNFIFSKV